MASESDPNIEEMVSTIFLMGDAERARWLERNCTDPELRSLVEAHLETQISPDLDDDATMTTSPTSAPEGLAVGARIGTCVLERLIGEGGMGAVYQARQDGLGRRVAVKLMKEGLITRSARQRFAYEARLLASLRHPGIAQVFESGTHEGAGGIVIPYFVMELIPDGRPVTRYVAESDLERDEVVDVFARICDGVHYAHQHGVVHRDLKPANILVDDQGQPKVIDFGLARDLHEDFVTRSFQTATGALVGTLPYMSPEQLSGDGAAIDTRSDVYSLGVVLYELVCGRRPFDFTDLALPDAVALVRDRPVPAPPRDVPRDLVKILGKGLHKVPEKRYASADGFAEDIRRYRRGLPVEARASTLTYNLRLFARRNRALVTAAALVLLASVSAAIVSFVFAVKAEQARAREAERADAADRLLASSNALSEWVMLEFVPKLRDVPGSTKLSEETVTRVLAHLDAISTAASDDPRHLRTVGMAYLEAGMLQGSPSFPNLGRTDDALVSLERACAAFEKLTAKRPGEIEPRLDLRVARFARAEVLLDVGRADEARAVLDRVVGELEGMRREAPENIRLARVLANVYATLAESSQRRGDWPAAEKRMLAVIELHESLLPLVPHPKPENREIGGARLSLADVLTSAGRPLEAVDHARRGLESLKRAYGANTDSADAMADYAVAHRTMGDALTVGEDIDGARREFELALALREKIVAAHPDEMTGLQSLSNVIQRLADITFGPGGDVAAALPLYRRQLGLERRIRALSPDNTQFRLRLRMALQRFAQALIVQGEIDEAQPLVVEQNDIAKALLTEAPDDPRFRRGLAEAVAQRAHVFVGRATATMTADPIPRLEEAIALFLESVSIYDALTADGVTLPGMVEVRESVKAQAAACEELIEKLEDLVD